MGDYTPAPLTLTCVLSFLITQFLVAQPLSESEKVGFDQGLIRPPRLLHPHQMSHQMEYQTALLAVACRASERRVPVVTYSEVRQTIPGDGIFFR